MRTLINLVLIYLAGSYFFGVVTSAQSTRSMEPCINAEFNKPLVHFEHNCTNRHDLGWRLQQKREAEQVWRELR